MSVPYTPPDLRGKVALVTGATRGAGRGIAVALGEAGATVYCTGRSSRATRSWKRSGPLRLETIEETAERVTVRGGIGIPVVVDHTDRAAVQMLISTIEKEQHKLDILVNVIWGWRHISRIW
jgi:NAD(P)-dependent dehydrogenase (short-subunit alcohol dehydrogenase family)